ncbi:MAG TPA: histidine phosphatase family protein [Pyrinomonadaceae bacterium]|nr:histidine phosphatase family protein [Pyrinomonadaceae bacterium]
MKNPQSQIQIPKSLWLVRHGESTSNIARQIAESEKLLEIDFPEREADVPLSELGKKQSATVGKWFAAQAEKPSIIYSSPYVRTFETTKIIQETANFQDIKIRFDERLRERELGVFDRLTKLGALAKYAEESARRELHGKFYHRPAGGESWIDVVFRLRSFIETDLSKLTNEKVLIVTHEVVIHCFRYILENLTEAEILEIDRARDISNCAITSYEFEGVNCALKLENFSAE